MNPLWKSRFNRKKKRDSSKILGNDLDTYDSEKLDKSAKVVVCPYDFSLQLELRMDIVEISRGLNRIVPKSNERIIGLLVPPFLHIPTR